MGKPTALLFAVNQRACAYPTLSAEQCAQLTLLLRRQRCERQCSCFVFIATSTSVPFFSPPSHAFVSHISAFISSSIALRTLKAIRQICKRAQHVVDVPLLCSLHCARDLLRFTPAYILYHLSPFNNVIFFFLLPTRFIF